ncbi:MAG: class I SAM-dependent methyltransferase [Desulfovibrio sp.]|jgi:2-polyprenyl-3-methyl-5-hydroxy-6-metoxy-1,4-benzoquinol methylase|nr:class I SAM-dependent methyltransferase [Desulfovibrio sp.]
MEPAEKIFAEKDISEVRAYWNSRPCNLRHSPKPVGSREYFDEVEARKYFVEPHIPLFAEFSRWKGKKVLEIGCGMGTDTINFARAGAKVTAVDISEESLRLARQRADIFGCADIITFVQADAEKLTDFVPPEPYDLVYSFGVIHHTPHPEAVIEQVRKYMHENSLFKVMVYNKLSWKVLWILLKYGKGRWWKLDELIARYSEAQTGCPITYSYTVAGIKLLLRGMTVRRVFVEHIFPYSILEYTRYEYKKMWYFDMLPEMFFRRLEQNFGWHLCAEAMLSRQNPAIIREKVEK